MTGSDRKGSRSDGAAVKLSAFGLLLVVVMGLGALAGAAFGPEPEDTGVDHEPANPTAEQSGGQVGYRLVVADAELASGTATDLRFVVTGPDGGAVIGVDDHNGAELQLVLVGQQPISYTRLDPVRDADGTWRVTLPALQPGTYRAYAELTPDGGTEIVVGADVVVSTGEPVTDHEHEGPP